MVNRDSSAYKAGRIVGRILLIGIGSTLDKKSS